MLEPVLQQLVCAAIQTRLMVLPAMIPRCVLRETLVRLESANLAVLSPAHLWISATLLVSALQLLDAAILFRPMEPPAMMPLCALPQTLVGLESALEAILSPALLWINATTLASALQPLEFAAIQTRPMELHVPTGWYALRRTLANLEFALVETLLFALL